MAITTVKGTLYQKVNGQIVKMHPETVDSNVNVDLYKGEAGKLLSEVLADLELRLNNIEGIDVFNFQGGVSSTSPLPSEGYDIGYVYRVVEGGTYAGQACEPGDVIYCVGTAGNDSDWLVTQANIDGAVTGPSESVNNNFAVFDGVSGGVIKDSGISATKIASMEQAIEANATAASAAAGAAAAAQGEVDALEEVVSTNKAAADKTQEDLDTLEAAFEAYKGTNDVAVKAAADAAAAAQSDADALEGRMDTAEGDIEDLQAQIDALTGADEGGDATSITALAARLTAVEGVAAENTTLAQKGVDDAATAQAAAEAADGKAVAAQGEVDALEGVVAELSGTVSSNKTAADTGIQEAKDAAAAADTKAAAAAAAAATADGKAVAAQGEVDALEGVVSAYKTSNDEAVAGVKATAEQGVADAATAQAAAEAAQGTADANAEAIEALEAQKWSATAASDSEEDLAAAAANLVEGGLIVVQG